MHKHLVQAPDHLCIHLERHTQHLTEEVIFNDTCVYCNPTIHMTVFQDATVKTHAHMYHLAARIEHLGLDKASHYRSQLILASDNLDRFKVAFTEDFTPAVHTTAPIASSQTVLLWYTRADVINLPTDRAMQMHRHKQDIQALFR